MRASKDLLPQTIKIRPLEVSRRENIRRKEEENFLNYKSLVLKSSQELFRIRALPPSICAPVTSRSTRSLGAAAAPSPQPIEVSRLKFSAPTWKDVCWSRRICSTLSAQIPWSISLGDLWCVSKGYHRWWGKENMLLSPTLWAHESDLVCFLIPNVTKKYFLMSPSFSKRNSATSNCAEGWLRWTGRLLQKALRAPSRSWGGCSPRFSFSSSSALRGTKALCCLSSAGFHASPKKGESPCVHFEMKGGPRPSLMSFWRQTPIVWVHLKIQISTIS